MALAYLLYAYTAQTQCWPFCKLGTHVTLLCELHQLHRLCEECCPACTASLFCSSAIQKSYCFAHFSVFGCQSPLSRMCCAELRHCLIIRTDARERSGMLWCRLMQDATHRASPGRARLAAHTQVSTRRCNEQHAESRMSLEAHHFQPAQ